MTQTGTHTANAYGVNNVYGVAEDPAPPDAGWLIYAKDDGGGGIQIWMVTSDGATTQLSGTGSGLPPGLTYVTPDFRVGTNTDNQAVVSGSASGDPVRVSTEGSDTDIDLVLESSGSLDSGVSFVSGALSARLGRNDEGDRGLFFDSTSTPWVSTINKGLNVEPGRSSSNGHGLSLSGGEPALIADADGGGITVSGTNGLGTGTGGHIQISAGSADLVTGTGGTLFLSSGDGATPGDIVITASAGGATGTVAVDATASSFTGTVQVGTRTGSAATFACFTVDGKLVESVTACA